MTRADVVASATQDLDAAAQLAADAWPRLAFNKGERAWSRAAQLVKSCLAATSALPLERRMFLLMQEAQTARGAAITDSDEVPRGAVQVMNMHQTKGRELDATISVYPEDLWIGYNAAEPYVEESRLLYVTLTRAAKEAVVLLPPSPHQLISPFVRFARDP